MAKILPKVYDPKLPNNVAVFQDHLALGLECFDLDWFDFRPLTCTHKNYGDGILFSQFEGVSENFAAEFALIVSDSGLHAPRENDIGFLPFSNEQPPTKMALLVLSAIVMKRPLNFEYPHCD